MSDPTVTREKRVGRLSIDDIEKLIGRNHKLYIGPDGSVSVTAHSLAAIEDRSADLERLLEAQTREVERLQALINTPHTADFLEAVKLEAIHQRERWGSEHDSGKTDADWFWLVGYLAGKALHKPEKQVHHIITTAAALLNWHAAATGADTRMRPGIEPPRESPHD